MITLDILICTIDDGIIKIPEVLLPPMQGISWVVSMQYTDRRLLDMVPDELRNRDDVCLTFIEGRGLSANRNNALAHSRADVVLIADDDCRYTSEDLRRAVRFMEHNPSYDIVCFASASYEGLPLKQYPKRPTLYKEAVSQGYYPSSVEICMRRNLGLRFDERFGLGSKFLCAGEEDVFLHDAFRAGYTIVVNSLIVACTDSRTTGGHLVGNKKLQLTKGAVFRYIYGLPGAMWRTVKEAGYYLVYRHVNPLPILYNMLRGLWILR